MHRAQILEEPSKLNIIKTSIEATDFAIFLVIYFQTLLFDILTTKVPYLINDINFLLYERKMTIEPEDEVNFVTRGVAKYSCCRKNFK